MLITNREDRYGIVAILLHWIMAVLIIGLLVEGIYMVRIPVSLQKLQLFGWHKELGVLVFMLVTCRLMWRLGNITPELESVLTVPELFAARTVHYLFYVCMFLMPVTGWLLTASAGLPVSFFGLFVIPNPIAPNEQSMALYTSIHKWLGYFLILLICGHVSAALKHHFINKDNVLRRML